MEYNSGVISVEEARERILSRISILGSERVELPGALGRVLSERLDAGRDIPPWPNSSMRPTRTSGHDC